jgi:hypothetical protein
MNVVWIVGWGVDPEPLRQRATELAPGGSVALYRPTPQVLPIAAAADRVVAWSYGAFLLLDAFNNGTAFHGRVHLFSPFLAFCAEAGLGGKCQRPQVVWLKRWLRKDPTAALADFASRAGLAPILLLNPPPVQELEDGLQRMSEGMTDASPHRFACGLPPRWTAEIGAEDLLLDANIIANTLPGTRIIPGVGHSISELLPRSHAF